MPGMVLPTSPPLQPWSFDSAFLPEETRNISQVRPSQDQLNYPSPLLTTCPISPNFRLIIFKAPKEAQCSSSRENWEPLGPHKTPILRLLPPLGCRWDHTRAFLSGSKRWGFPAEDITTIHLRFLPWSPATYKVLTNTCADQKMPNNSCKGTLRTAKNKAWRLGMYFLPLESGHFQPTSWEEASQQGSQGCKGEPAPQRNPGAYSAPGNCSALQKDTFTTASSWGKTQWTQHF